ncbi:MAG: hypothetical protein D6702_10055 [Planctomycetota bacterium]|nr:MAG: hypothetical protein D6702_10055 [Planctomycetota bacterium]
MERLVSSLLLLAAGCGLLFPAPQPPPPDRVAAARAADEAEWTVLAEALRIRAEGGPDAAVRLQGLRRKAPGSVRLEALLQDFALFDARTEEERERLRARAEEEARASGDPVRLYLAARIAPRARARELIEEALARDPRLVPARVLRIGLMARAGRSESLDELLRLLEEAPGSAEGWRLLGRLAPFYGRPELAARAAAMEPWVPLADPTPVRLYRAETLLRAERPVAALAELDGLETPRARLLRAAALADAGRPEEAWAVLTALAEDRPEDPVVRFDLALLARDRLHRPEEARTQLAAFLDLAREQEVPLRRLLQAELWLEELAGS